MLKKYGLSINTIIELLGEVSKQICVKCCFSCVNDKKTMKNAGFCFSAHGMVYWKRKIRQPGGKKEKRKHENEIWHRGLWFPRQYRGRCVEEGPAGRLRAGGCHQPHLRFGREDGGKRGLCGLRGRGCSAGAGAGVHRGSRFGGSGARNGRSGAAPGREPRGAVHRCIRRPRVL